MARVMPTQLFCRPCRYGPSPRPLYRKDILATLTVFDECPFLPDCHRIRGDRKGWHSTGLRNVSFETVA